MEQDVDTGYRAVCSTCLSSDRNLISINCIDQVFQMFKILMYDFSGDRFTENLSDIKQLVCWECLALLRRFARFKRQVHSAQEHLRMLACSSGQETLDHQYMSHSLSNLEMVTRVDYDKIFFDYSTRPDWYDVKDECGRPVMIEDNAFEESVLDMSTIELDEALGDKIPHLIVSGSNTLLVPVEPAPSLQLMVSPLTQTKFETVITQTKPQQSVESKKSADKKNGYITTFMTDDELVEDRRIAMRSPKYACAHYKCELCVIGFQRQQQVEEHFMEMHRPKPNSQACPVCFVYVETRALQQHTRAHYTRHTCVACGRREPTAALMAAHLKMHADCDEPGIIDFVPKKRRKNARSAAAAEPGDLRRLLSRTTVEGYKCLECDKFFQTARARKTHVMKYHREGFECDHCHKRFVTKTTLATHIRLHEGPLPKEECPICHKMVRSIQIKYHIQRHQNKGRYECVECNKVYSHLATFQAHLKYARAHATEEIYKYPCPMCNKGYPTKEQMTDHFNYVHLGKTLHKCPICDKPIASRGNVAKHVMRVHSEERKQRPRTHVCETCCKAFTDRKSLVQHLVVHSGARPLVCDICNMTFKQKASLYTHRKRVHKVFPPKRDVHFMERIDA